MSLRLLHMNVLSNRVLRQDRLFVQPWKPGGLEVFSCSCFTFQVEFGDNQYYINLMSKQWAMRDERDTLITNKTNLYT